MTKRRIKHFEALYTKAFAKLEPEEGMRAIGLLGTVSKLPTVEDVDRFLRQLQVGADEGDVASSAVLDAFNSHIGWPGRVLVILDDLAQQPTIPDFPHFLLHLLLPRGDRQLVERDLEEQFEEESQDPLLGPSRAKLFYCTRTVVNLATYAWVRVVRRPTKIATAIVATIAVLKKLGITAAIAAALKRVGVPWL